MTVLFDGISQSQALADDAAQTWLPELIIAQ